MENFFFKLIGISSGEGGTKSIDCTVFLCQGINIDNGETIYSELFFNELLHTSLLRIKKKLDFNIIMP